MLLVRKMITLVDHHVNSKNVSNVTLFFNIAFIITGDNFKVLLCHQRYFTKYTKSV